MFFGLNLGARNAENPFGPFKVPKCNQKTAKLKKNCHLNGSCGSWREVGQKCWRQQKITWTSYRYISIKKNRHPKLKRFSLLQTTCLHESLEGLNSSKAQSDGELLPGAKCPPEWLLREQILVNFWFMSRNFCSLYARKSNKGSKNSDFGLVSKKILSQNNGPMGCGPGPGKGGQKKQKHPQLQQSPQRTPNRKRKLFFFYFKQKTCWIRGWFG